MARDWARYNTKYAVVGGCTLNYQLSRFWENIWLTIVDLSPVGDAYRKKGLAPAGDRVKMCELAVNTSNHGSHFTMVDTWEALQREYQPTAIVLDHFDYEINERLGGIDDGTGNKVRAKIALLGGADLVETFTQPGVWAKKDLEHMLCTCEYSYAIEIGQSIDGALDGAFIIERAGTDLEDVMSRLEPKWRDNIHVIHQVIARGPSKPFRC